MKLHTKRNTFTHTHTPTLTLILLLNVCVFQPNFLSPLTYRRIGNQYNSFASDLFSGNQSKYVVINVDTELKQLARFDAIYFRNRWLGLVRSQSQGSIFLQTLAKLLDGISWDLGQIYRCHVCGLLISCCTRGKPIFVRFTSRSIVYSLVLWYDLARAAIIPNSDCIFPINNTSYHNKPQHAHWIWIRDLWWVLPLKDAQIQ